MQEAEPRRRALAVLVVDDHPAVRQGLALLLAPEGITVRAEAGTRDEAVACAAAGSFDAAVVDLSLGADDGLDVVARFAAVGLHTLVYSMHEDARHIQAAFEAGALGYVTKREVSRVLVAAIGEVASGRRYVGPAATEALIDLVTHPWPADPESDLSEQERQVYRMLGAGEGTVEIAAALGISARTVESYYARIQAKLGVDGMRALRRTAIARTHGGGA